MGTAQAAAVNVVGAAVVASGPCTYRGFFISSVAGATVTIYDGTSAAGAVLASFVLAANGWASDDISDGVRCANGVYVDTGGVLIGHVRIG